MTPSRFFATAAACTLSLSLPALALAEAAFPVESPSGLADARFGMALSSAGDRFVVGAPYDDTTGNQSGRAYIFSAATRQLLATLENPSPGAGDQFGDAVSMSVSHVAVGAQSDNSTGSNSGRAYLFNAVTGALVHTFENPAPAGGDLFGNSVAVDGNHVLLGARDDDATGSNSGRAYLFDATTGSLIFTFENPLPSTAGRFGSAVAVSGGHLLIAAYTDDATGSNSGRAYLFDATTGNLVHTFENPSPATSDRFGSAVSIAGNRIVIGAHLDNTAGLNAGEAYLFDAVSGALVHTLGHPNPAAGDQFGYSVSVLGDEILVGADGDNAITGSAFLFDAITGNLTAAYNNPGAAPSTDDAFGTAVSLGSGQALVGSPYDDAAATDSGLVYFIIAGQTANIDVVPAVIHPHHVEPSLDDIIPVVVFGDDDFDTSLIATETLRFGPAGGAVDPASTPVFFADYDGDTEFDDAQFEFRMSATGIGCEQQSVALTGETTAGDAFVGLDSVSADCEAACH